MKLNLEHIPRVKTITKEAFLESYVKTQKPVIIERLLENCDAYEKWNLSYIKSIAGDRIVPIYDDRPITSDQKYNQAHTRMTMGDYIDLLQKGPTNYRIFLYNLLMEVPVLQKDFKFPDIGLKFFKKHPFVFFGGSGSKVFMHYDVDYANILHTQFNGKKQCILYPPSETKYLYKLPQSILAHQEIDFENPDFKKWPALQKAKGYSAVLDHGETLYMPEGYWHQMTYITPGFSISIRSLTKSKIRFVKGAYNIFILPKFENMMRRVAGEKWLDYKKAKAVSKTNGRID